MSSKIDYQSESFFIELPWHGVVWAVNFRSQNGVMGFQGNEELKRNIKREPVNCIFLDRSIEQRWLKLVRFSSALCMTKHGRMLSHSFFVILFHKKVLPVEALFRFTFLNALQFRSIKTHLFFTNSEWVNIKRLIKVDVDVKGCELKFKIKNFVSNIWSWNAEQNSG